MHLRHGNADHAVAGDDGGEPLFVPGCYDALTARVLEHAGFPALYMTGYGTSLALLGLPDAGLATMTEMHLNARYIANAVGVPVDPSSRQKTSSRPSRSMAAIRVFWPRS